MMLGPMKAKYIAPRKWVQTLIVSLCILKMLMKHCLAVKFQR